MSGEHSTPPPSIGLPAAAQAALQRVSDQGYELEPEVYTVPGGECISVYAFHSDGFVGSAVFAIIPERRALQTENVRVEETHRRRGVADAMYVRACQEVPERRGTEC